MTQKPDPAQDKLEKDLTDIKRDLSQLAEDVKTLAQSHLKRAQGNVEGKIRRHQNEFESQVHENPKQSIAWALGLGFIVAFLFRR